MKSRIVIFPVLAVSVAVALAACGSPGQESGSPSSATDQKLNIAFIPKQLNNPVFDIIAEGGKEAAKELGGEFQQVGPSDATGPAQIPFIQALTSKQIGAIAISANDPNAVAPALKAAMKQGIKVVGFDSSPATDARAAFVADSDAAGVGQVLAQMICDDIPDCAGQIAILSATSTSPVQNSWIDEMMKALAGDSKYSKLEVVKTVYGNDDPQVSTTATQGLLSAYPDLKGIVAPTSVGIVSAAQVLEQTGNGGKIALTGLATPNSMRKYVKDGVANNFALWNLNDLGYLTYYVAALTLDGTISGKAGETFAAGRLGEYTVGDDGVVVLGKPFIYDASNIDEFDF